MTTPDLSAGHCYGHPDPDLWHPPEHPNRSGAGIYSRVVQHQITEAALHCYGCPVTDVCLQYALDTGSTGVWAGTTTRQRARMRKQRRRARRELAP